MLKLGNILFLLVSLVACGGNAPSEASSAQAESTPAASSSDTWFEASGAANLRVESASASFYPNPAGVVSLGIVAGLDSRWKGYSVNLFFSKEFDPKPGTYPIEFSYMGKPNTLGASFLGAGRFSYNTEGEAEFTEFGDQVRVRFRFTSYNESERSPDRQSVTVTGEAVCEPGDAF